MPRKLRALRADLRRLGAQITAQVGSHEKWKHPLVKDLYVQLAGTDGDDAKPYQERDTRAFTKAVRAAEEAEPNRRQQ